VNVEQSENQVGLPRGAANQLYFTARFTNNSFDFPSVIYKQWACNPELYIAGLWYYLSVDRTFGGS